mmetsp:Transcript_34040/g.90693  ORF Transcript_34040/g.90693 Transcript_34040/m.90693 type:complete len:91 (+) Transcript_34040:437-709(+)
MLTQPSSQGSKIHHSSASSGRGTLRIATEVNVAERMALTVCLATDAGVVCARAHSRVSEKARTSLETHHCGTVDKAVAALALRMAASTDS